MKELRFASDRILDHWYLINAKLFRKDAFSTLFVCLIFLVPMSMYGQDSSSFAEARLACAQGIGQQAVTRARAMGYQKGIADLCVTALNWMANNGKLLDIYTRETGEGDARLLVSSFTDHAGLSAGLFRASDSPLAMWKKGELTPSLAFDAGFTRSFLERQKTPSGSMTVAELKRTTEGCFNLTESLALCADAGRIQGALAYQTSNAFSDNSAMPAPKTETQGPDRVQTEAAIDRKFQIWSQSWSFDRYRPGSVQIADVNCSGQCKASGRFSFVRMGALHTIAFVAFLSSEADGRFSVGRLCYKDDTTNMLDCTD